MQRLLEHEGIPIEGQNVVVVGASNIVGKPTALMLMQREATVTICHAKTRDLAQYTRPEIISSQRRQSRERSGISCEPRTGDFRVARSAAWPR